MRGQSPILQALGYDESGLKALLAPVYGQGCTGEVFLSTMNRRRMVLTDKRVQAPVVSGEAGGGLRRIHGLKPDFVSFTGLTAANLEKAVSDLKNIPTGTGGATGTAPVPDFAVPSYYGQDDVLGGKTDDDVKRLLQEIDDYVRSADKRVTQVTVGTVAEGTHILIARADGKVLTDHRPFVTLRVEVVMAENGRKEQGVQWYTQRVLWSEVFKPEVWRTVADRALEMARNNLTSIPAPTGTDLEVVVANGWGGVILHEAFGHGLEADFHMKKVASLQGKLGQRVAAKGVTVVEDGTVDTNVGSLHFDDEGNPTQRNVLVEDGIMVKLMTDSISAAALNMPLTGNGRRESFAYRPLPRMTNTFMLGDKDGTTPEQLIAGVKRGVYCSNFSGGTVNITTGKFSFDANEARLIENGKLGAFVKGVNLQGMGNKAYLGVSGIADDSRKMPGWCGKEGQTVCVSVGQPTIKLDAGYIAVGGTKA